jgi:multiple antibiotic resistance protein
MNFNVDHFLSVTFTLFAVIDILGATPLLISLKKKMGGIRELWVTLISGAFMIIFLLAGDTVLKILGVDVGSFAVAGSLVIFFLGLEMILGHEIFKSEESARSGTVVPLAFPLIAGSGTLTTIMSLKANYREVYIYAAIFVNLVIIYIVLKSLGMIEKVLGKTGLIAVRKFFGVILLAIAIKIFSSNVSGLIK